MTGTFGDHIDDLHRLVREVGDESRVEHPRISYGTDGEDRYMVRAKKEADGQRFGVECGFDRTREYDEAAAHIKISEMFRDLARMLDEHALPVEIPWPRSYDVDTDVLAEALHDIANGIEDGSVRIQEADGGLQSTAEDASRSVGGEIRLKYHGEHMTDAMLYPLQFDPEASQ